MRRFRRIQRDQIGEVELERGLVVETELEIELG
jgi:hypothetical protein